MLLGPTLTLPALAPKAPNLEEEDLLPVSSAASELLLLPEEAEVRCAPKMSLAPFVVVAVLAGLLLSLASAGLFGGRAGFVEAPPPTLCFDESA